MFTRQEHQKFVGNLHHLHMIIEVATNELAVEQKSFIDDLVMCSHFEVARVDEVQKLIDDETFKNMNDYH